MSVIGPRYGPNPDLVNAVFRERELATVLRRDYAGKWVAIKGYEVIASADTEDGLGVANHPGMWCDRWMRVLPDGVVRGPSPTFTQADTIGDKTAPKCRYCGYVPRSGEDRRCPAKSHLPSMSRGHSPEDFVDVPIVDLDWLRRLDVHLRAYETTGEPLPLVSLREEIDCALLACGLTNPLDAKEQPHG